MSAATMPLPTLIIDVEPLHHIPAGDPPYGLIGPGQVALCGHVRRTGAIVTRRVAGDRVCAECKRLYSWGER